MSSPHRILHDIFRAPFLGEDPGAAGAIVFNKWGSVIPLVHTTGAGTRTLAAPTKAGMQVTLELQSITSGEITVTVATAYDQAGSTTLEFDDAGDFVVLHSIKTGASTWSWRVLGFDGVTGPAIELQELAAETALTIDIAGTDRVKFTSTTIEPITDNDIDLATLVAQFKDGYFAGIVYANEFDTAGGMVLNSVDAIEVQISGVNLLVFDDSGITSNAGATGVAGKNVFIETQDGGAVTTGVAGLVGGAHSFKTGDGSQGFETENEDGGNGGDITRTAGDGGRAGLLAAGTADGGDGASITDVAGDGGNGGDASGNDGDGGSHALIVGSAGSGGGGTAGADGVIRLSGTVAHKQGTPGTVTAAATLTVAEMLGGIITGTQSTGSTNNLQLPTGTAMQAALPGSFAVDDAFDITVINASAAAADTYTLTENTGSGNFTVVGHPIIDGVNSAVFGSGSATFRCRKTASNTFVAYRIS